uniref:Uncharacterized protein n=1 Tax=Tetraselmis sp. GSL018 TaxID=582737 RepID=A0A061R1E6_9CHLO|mmetsp:Transcript_42558/g.101025  ORF Transcript_42558/g.101025 Transcript_42558/m.101025 type:complete len:461 (-) Transcript_42558:554-1936(-)
MIRCQLENVWRYLFVLLCSTFAATLATSQLVPYLPLEAVENWGAGPAAVGISLSIVPAVCVVFTPICAIACESFERFHILSLSLFLLTASLCVLSAASSILAADVALSIQGICSAAVSTITLSSASVILPQNMALFVGLREAALGLGNVAGPLIGGFLYETGGMHLSCICFAGGILLLTMTVIRMNCRTEAIVPSAPVQDTERLETPLCSSREKTPKKLFGPKLMLLLVSHCVSAVLASIASGLMLPILALEARDAFSAGPGLSGAVVAASSAIYVVLSPLLGLMADRTAGHLVLLCGGCLLCSASLSLAAPPYFVARGSKAHLACFTIGNSAMGAASAAALVPILPHLVGSVPFTERRMQLKISGLCAMMFSLGDVLGPSAGGLAYKHIGFQATFFLAAAAMFAWAICLAAMAALGLLPWRSAALPGPSELDGGCPSGPEEGLSAEAPADERSRSGGLD